MPCATSLMGTIEHSELREILANKALVLPVVAIRGETLMLGATAMPASHGLGRGRHVLSVSPKGFACWT